MGDEKIYKHLYTRELNKLIYTDPGKTFVQKRPEKALSPPLGQTPMLRTHPAHGSSRKKGHRQRLEEGAVFANAQFSTTTKNNKSIK